LVIYSVTVVMTTRYIDGVAIHSLGTGSPVVLLHANGGDHHDFDAVSEELGRHATVHSIDWPGHGDSDAVPDPSACVFADLLPELLEQLDDGPFVLVGNSVGGFAALRAAARRPDLVRGLVLVNAGGFTPRLPTTFLACRLFGWKRVAPIAMRLLPRLYLRRNTDAVAEVRRRMDIASRVPDRVRAFASIWRSFTAGDHDARPDAAHCSVPTVLVWGTRDPILPWPIDGRRARKALPNAQLIKFPCGHQSHVEMPEAFLTETIGFISGPG
jgi:pimeloyl-ACP methyl ester carboxylesterase